MLLVGLWKSQTAPKVKPSTNMRRTLLKFIPQTKCQLNSFFESRQAAPLRLEIIAPRATKKEDHTHRMHRRRWACKRQISNELEKDDLHPATTRTHDCGLVCELGRVRLEAIPLRLEPGATTLEAIAIN